MILTLLLFIPFTVNIFILIIYIYTNIIIYRKRFLLTAFFSFGLLGLVLFISRFSMPLFEALNFTVLFWLLSGYLLSVAISVKIFIFSRLYKRHQDPNNFHYNFFGKKVMHSGFLTKKEMGFFVISIPAFLFAGAYFVARLINLILYGHL